MDTGLIIGLSVWGACGFAAYGLTLAKFQKQYLAIAREHRLSDFGFALFSGVTGPCGLLAHVLSSRGEEPTGFLLLPLNDEQWSELARQRYGQWFVDLEFRA